MRTVVVALTLLVFFSVEAAEKKTDKRAFKMPKKSGAAAAPAAEAALAPTPQPTPAPEAGAAPQKTEPERRAESPALQEETKKKSVTPPFQMPNADPSGATDSQSVEKPQPSTSPAPAPTFTLPNKKPAPRPKKNPTSFRLPKKVTK